MNPLDLLLLYAQSPRWLAELAAALWLALALPLTGAALVGLGAKRGRWSVAGLGLALLALAGLLGGLVAVAAAPTGWGAL